jgi:hypothetical protein
MQAATLKRVSIAAVGSLGLAVILVPFQGMIWDGRFHDVEYRLTFLDEAGRPLPGISLQVVSKAGGPSYLYPINEFLPDGTPSTDANGLVTFHHVGAYLEFSGYEYHNLAGMRFSDTDAPQYVLVFSLAGREVHRVRHDDLRPRGEIDRLPKVTRKWQASWCPSRETLSDIVWDGNGDGKIDREEGTARTYGQTLSWAWAEDREEVTFRVVEKTIVIPVR